MATPWVASGWLGLPLNQAMCSLLFQLLATSRESRKAASTAPRGVTACAAAHAACGGGAGTRGGRLGERGAWCVLQRLPMSRSQVTRPCNRSKPGREPEASLRAGRRAAGRKAAQAGKHTPNWAAHSDCSQTLAHRVRTCSGVSAQALQVQTSRAAATATLRQAPRILAALASLFGTRCERCHRDRRQRGLRGAAGAAAS